MKGVGNFSYSKIDASKPHFLIYYSPEYGSKNWRPIALLSSAPTVAEMQLTLLTHDAADVPVLKMMHKELDFYLLKLKNPDPVAYLHYHCSTMSNIYSNIHFSYVSEIKNILYYIEITSKIIGTYMVQQVSNMQEVYMKCLVDQLFDKVINGDNQNEAVRNYNQDLYYIFDLLFIHLPKQNGFEITERPNILEFARQLSYLDIIDYCNSINYLKKIKLLKIQNVKWMLTFHYINKKIHQDIKSSSKC